MTGGGAPTGMEMVGDGGARGEDSPEEEGSYVSVTCLSGPC